MMSNEEREAMQEASDRITFNLNKYGQAATWVGLNEKNQVEIKVLSNEQCDYFIKRQEAGLKIPPTVRVVKVQPPDIF